MSKTNGTSNDQTRYVVGARLLGKDKNHKKRFREVEYAIEVTLSDESQYTIYRPIKEIALFHSRLRSRFRVESGYFNKSERVIPECPVRQSIFGPQRVVRDDSSFEKLLNSYFKELPALPASIVKSSFMENLFTLRATDICLPGQNANARKKKKANKRPKLTRAMSENSIITGPMKLRSYYAVASYSDQKSKFSFSEGTLLQLLQKDSSGWWMVDAGGVIGWAPASFLVPVDEEDLSEEAKENEQIVGWEKVGARYVSISSYQASRDDELSFVRGAVVKVIKKYVDGWWLVRYNGGEGFVPGALFRKFDRRQATVYVKNIKRKFISQKSVRIVPTMKPKWLNDQNESTGGLTVYQCKANFSDSSNQSAISFNKNDMVKVLDKQDHGWWYVEDLHGRSGWAPASFLKPVLDKGHQRNGDTVGSTLEVLQQHHAQQQDELSVQKGEKVMVVLPSDDGWWLVRNTETQRQGLIPSMCLKYASGESSRKTSLDLPPESVLIGDASSTWSELERLQEDTDGGDTLSLDNIEEFATEECYIATQDYSRQAPDELDIYEGQLVCVIDDTQEDTWYVNMDGKEGWLPSSILRIMTDEELGGSATTSPSRTKLSSHGTSADASDFSDSDEPGVSPSSARLPLPQSLPLQRQRRSSAPQTYPKQTSPPEVMAWSRKINLGAISDSELLEHTPVESPVTILVENRSLKELEREAAEREAAQAERDAEKALKRARQLRNRAQQLGSTGFSSE